MSSYSSLRVGDRGGKTRIKVFVNIRGVAVGFGTIIPFFTGKRSPVKKSDCIDQVQPRDPL